MIQNYQNPTGRGSAELAVPIKYGELRELRDKGVLVAGTWYRITDYFCITSQENIKSAVNQFDIIVRADDASHLNENAFAAHHDGDKYFDNCKLEAWELKYCIDNDDMRFPWANKEKGTGVIFYMKDEWNNECPYDFKNIMFKRYMVGEDLSGERELVNRYLYPVTEKEGPALLKPLLDKYIYAYTFSSDAKADTQIDYSLEGMKNRVFGNIICIINGKLPDNVFYGENCHSNKLYNCHGNSFDKHCYINLLSGCYDNSFAKFCFMNSFGSECYTNSFGSNNYHNFIGNNCYGNSFNSGFQKNCLGNYCVDNLFGNNINNSFGNDCQSNIFGDYIRNCTVFDGVEYCKVIGGDKDKYVQNAQILNGTTGKSKEEMLIIEFEIDSKVIQVAGKRKDGVLKIFNPADFAV